MIFSKGLKSDSLFFNHLSNIDDISYFFNKDVVDKLENYFCIALKRRMSYCHQLTSNTHLFDCFEESVLTQLQTENNSLLFFDFSYEGYSLFDEPNLQCLHYNCKKYNVNPSKIVFLTSNLKDDEAYNQYANKRNIDKRINIISYPYFELYTLYSCKDGITCTDIEEKLNATIEETSKQYQGHFLSSLSRVNRFHRTAGTFILSMSSLKDKSLISHNTLTNREIHAVQALLRSNRNTSELLSKFQQWTDSLPLTVDDIDFNINQFQNLNEHIHSKTLFQIVNETMVDNSNNTSLCISEKTYKPIYNLQPFVIYGQQGVNKELESHGFKLYHDHFDYSFDDEPDNILRYKKMLDMLVDVTKDLHTLSKKQQIEWRFKDKHRLTHNLNRLYNFSYITDKLNTSMLKILN